METMFTIEAIDLLLGSYGFPITVAVTSVVSLVFLVLKHDSQSEKREKRIQKEAKDREDKQQKEALERENRLYDDLKKRDEINTKREDKLMKELRSINETNKQLVETSRVITEGLTKEFRDMKEEMSNKFGHVEENVKHLDTKIDTVLDVIKKQ